MNLPIVIATAACAGITVAVVLKPLIAILKARHVLDIPGSRSSHDSPTPTGAGLVLVPVICVCWIIGSEIDGSLDDTVSTFLIATLTLGLMGLAWIDDLRQLSPLLRVAVHFACAGVAVSILPHDALLLQGMVPLATDRVLAVVALVWFINLFNFMDGIDGISAVETMVCTAGLLVVGSIVGLSGHQPILAAALFGSAAGFLVWNWHPAKIFLGDAGSAPIGFLLGWSLINLAAFGQWQAALILPLYYLADATLTLFLRVCRGERFWEAHRQHCYQTAVQRGFSHSDVVVWVAFAGLIFIASAVSSALGHPLAGLVAAAVVVFALLMRMARSDRPTGRPRGAS